jgi:tetratricopeptide (TPR) repeat protein
MIQPLADAGARDYDSGAMLRRVLISMLAVAAQFAVAAPTHADWVEASSDHFVIYGDQEERTAIKFAERLERFHDAMAYVYKKPQSKPGPSNRVTIFVVSSSAKVRQILATKDRWLGAVYIPRAGACIALVPSLKGLSDWGQMSLFHEYAHHFMYGHLTARAYPRWFSEGFAEFFASLRFEKDGTVLLGAPANVRGAELAYAREVPIRTLLAFDGGRKAGQSYDSFYGQSWVLFHYLQMAPERAGQLAKYQNQLAKGHPALEAAEAAMGDLDQLERDMDAYVKRRKLAAMVVPATALDVGVIQVRELRRGEAAMMPTMIESKAGVDRDEALQLVPEARKVAALYPDDPAVLSALAEAEFDAGNDDAAIAAADRAIATDPKQINAHIQKGYALARKVETGVLPKEAWKDVRQQFIKANGVENDHPIPLVEFYLTYLKQGIPPTKNSIDGLEWALTLAPFDGSLRWLVAQQMVADARYEDAVTVLGPLAYSPHPGEHTDAARQLLKEVEAKLGENGAEKPAE